MVIYAIRGYYYDQNLREDPNAYYIEFHETRESAESRMAQVTLGFEYIDDENGNDNPPVVEWQKDFYTNTFIEEITVRKEV